QPASVGGTKPRAARWDPAARTCRPASCRSPRSAAADRCRRAAAVYPPPPDPAGQLLVDPHVRLLPIDVVARQQPAAQQPDAHRLEVAIPDRAECGHGTQWLGIVRRVTVGGGGGGGGTAGG